MSQAGSIKMSVFPWDGSGTIMIYFFQFLLDHCSFHRIRDNCFIMYCGVSWRRQWHPTPVLLQKNPMDGGAWKAAVHGVAEGRTRLSDFTFIFHFHALEKEMATHSSVLAWRIPGTGEPGGLLSMGPHRVGRDWSDLAAAAVESVWRP